MRSHNLFVVRDTQNKYEKEWCGESVQDGGVIEHLKWWNTDEAYNESNQHGNNHDAVKAACIAKFFLKSSAPTKCFGHGEGCGSCKNWDSEHTGSDNAEGKKKIGKISDKWTQGLCCLGCGFDRHRTIRSNSGGNGHHNEKHDEV